MSNDEQILSFTSAGGTWETRVLTYDFASVDQHMNLFFKSQMRVGVSARRDVTEDGSVTYRIWSPIHHVEGEISIYLIRLGNDRTRIIGTASEQKSETLIYFIRHFEAWIEPVAAEANRQNEKEPRIKDSNEELSQEFVFDENAEKVCAYIMGGENWERENIRIIDRTNGLYVMRAWLSVIPSPSTLYFIGIMASIIDGIEFDYREEAKWLLNCKEVGSISIEQDRVGKCRAKFYIESNPRRWGSDYTALWSVGPDLLGLIWHDLIQGWISFKARSKQEAPQSDSVVLRRKPPGRRPDPENEEAFRIIIEGEETEEAWHRAYDYWCHEKSIEEPNKRDRDAFKKAMKRAAKRAERGDEKGT